MKLITTIKPKYIADAKDVFTSYIDSDFKEWNTNIGDELAVCEPAQNMTFKQIFTKPEEMCLTQEQIIQYCREHKDLIGEYSTFFLFKVGVEFFVAHVYVFDGLLRAFVFRFSVGSVWYAGCQRRFVFPQLATQYLSFDPLTTSPLDTLSGKTVKIEVEGKTFTAIIQ